MKTGNVFILQTNHLTYHHVKFLPNDWWSKLKVKDNKYRIYTELFDLLPYAVKTRNGGFIACHGIPVNNLSNAENILIGSSDWHSLTWGRLSDQMVTPLYIKSVLRSNNANIIIRSHDHYSQTKSFNNKVLTFTTSKNLPDTKRIIVEVDLNRRIKSIDDVKLIDIDREIASGQN